MADHQTRHRTSAAPLAWIYGALIVYASLYPFTGWSQPGGSVLAFLSMPWSRWWSGFDLVANLLGYIPLGALVFGALVRTGHGPGIAWPVAVTVATLLSLGLEVLQNFLPQRVASNVDLGLNALGAALGAAIGLGVHWRGWADRWQHARDRWFIDRSAGGLALLLLWPLGLLFPTPVPLGVGQVFGHLHQTLTDWLDGTRAVGWLERLRSLQPLADAADPFPPGHELAVMAVGLLGPCLVAFAIARQGWRRLVLVAGVAALGCAATTLSTVLNFGPQHALAWNTPQALSGLALGAGAAMLLSPVARPVAAGLGAVALTALVVLVANAPADPYFADSLQAWEQGRFIRFHGAAQWVGWLWPYAAIAYLLARLAARDPEPQAGAPKMPG